MHICNQVANNYVCATEANAIPCPSYVIMMCCNHKFDLFDIFDIFLRTHNYDTNLAHYTCLLRMPLIEFFVVRLY